ncbi:MAG TPA: hypothetical protein VER04_10260 [Polyangiaceae bacterium]|nr:hypothetical protein [Polyangiaceae bacterium]
MKCRPLPLLSCIPFAVALSAGLVGCGRIRNDPGAAGAPSGGRGGSSGAGGVVLPGGSAGDAEGGAVSEATYAGAVLAMLTEHDGTESYVARAVFAAGPRPTIGGCPQCCCSSTDRGLPLPDKPPDASRITLLPTAGGAALATLVPELFEDGHGAVHGMIDLGWSWFAALSDYAAAPSQAWKAGDVLEVTALGNEVEPFSGMLRAGPALSGVTPAIGSAPLVVDHTQPFEISWTPEGDANAIMLLGIPNADGVCYCDAPNSAGSLVVDSALLSAAAGEISLARLTISNVASKNASVDLVGAIVQRGPVEVR